MGAVRSGSYDALVAMLAADVSLKADAGGRVRGAATRELLGRDAVARFVLASIRFLPPGAEIEIADVNGRPAALLRVGGAVAFVIALAVAGDEIAEIHVLANPDKLQHLA